MGSTFEAAIERARRIVHQLIQQNTSAHEQFQDDWPSTVGTVESISSDVAPGDRSGSIFVGEISYSYEVEGQYYAGFYQLAGSSEGEVEAMLKRWKGRKTTVRYSPKHNAVSIMTPYEPLPGE